MKSINNISLLLFITLFITPSLAINFNQINQESEKVLLNYISVKESLNSRSGNSFQSIGSDNACDINVNVANIQLVIDSGATEIRLSNNATYNEDIFINDQSLIIKGGYADCEDANNNQPSNTKTFITGTNTAPVISISGSSETHEILLENLVLTNGKGSDFFPGGGISTLSTNANIKLNNVLIENNTGNLGGGIAISSGQTNLILEDTIIKNNIAAKGGGIMCDSEDASVLMLGESGLLDNFANDPFIGEGGGMYIASGCLTTILSGSSEVGTEYGVVGNKAKKYGGGFYLESSARLDLLGQQICILDVCFGDSSQPVNISHNVAEDHTAFHIDGFGGGIFSSGGSETQINMSGVLFNRNVAHFKGAGIYLGNHVQLNINRQPSKCWNKTRCNLFQANQTINAEDDEFDTTEGGAIYNSGGVIEIEHAYFEDNRADIGTALYLGSSTPTHTHIKSSVFNNNGDFGLGLFEDNYVIVLKSIHAELTLTHTTIADNNAQLAVIGRLNQSNLSINIYNSIIDDANTGLILSNNVPMLSDINCLISHESVSLGDSASNVLVLDPKFKNRTNRDYHLNAVQSPAVDFCAQPTDDDGFSDIDNQARGWDDNTIQNYQNNPNFIFDAGADETYDNDIIFKNGFTEI